jgi:DNA-binding GntR family transcriptional regulator
MEKIVKSDLQDHASARTGTLLADRVLTFLRAEIYEGRLASGDRINELEVSHKLGISRGPVREAIRLLSSSGLVTYEANVGARVVSPDEEDVAQLYDVREALESTAARLAATHMTATERETLLRTLDAHDAQMTEANSNSYPRGNADWDFHLLILKGARNGVIWRICGDELRDVFSLLRSRHGSSPRRGRRALQEHRWIAEAVAAGHGDLAAALMAQHIRASRDNLLAAMRRDDDAESRLRARGAVPRQAFGR